MRAAAAIALLVILPLPARAGGLIPVDFAPTPQTPSAPAVFSPTLSRPALGDSLFDNSAAEGIKQALASQIRMPPLTVPERAKVEIAWLGGQLADHPDDPVLLARRCLMRGLAKTDLDAALDDCNRAIALKPMAGYRGQRALVFYLKGDYRAALTGYDEALAADPILGSSLLMRGMTKGKLGDAAGKDKDVAAAQALDANIITCYRDFGILPR